MTVTLTLPPDIEEAIQKAAQRNGQTTEEAVTDALRKLFAPDDEYKADQRQRHEILAQIIAEAQAIEPEPWDSPSRRAARENPVTELIAEKFRRQGFNL